MAIKTCKQKDMGYSSNFDKIFMWTCTNEQLVTYIWYRASYLIAYSISYLYTYILFLFPGKKDV